ncbi:hypothetical protein AB4851_29115 [Burkholderia sp. 22PA0099]|uniref:hypothetical protein n=1 Tax=Burkholderia sp. 22PA0099 TaxID=3237372 RepID=UPI0039C0132E
MSGDYPFGSRSDRGGFDRLCLAPSCAFSRRARHPARPPFRAEAQTLSIIVCGFNSRVFPFPFTRQFSNNNPYDPFQISIGSTIFLSCAAFPAIPAVNKKKNKSIVISANKSPNCIDFPAREQG